MHWISSKTLIKFIVAAAIGGASVQLIQPGSQALAFTGVAPASTSETDPVDGSKVDPEAWWNTKARYSSPEYYRDRLEKALLFYYKPDMIKREFLDLKDGGEIKKLVKAARLLAKDLIVEGRGGFEVNSLVAMDNLFTLGIMPDDNSPNGTGQTEPDKRFVKLVAARGWDASTLPGLIREVLREQQDPALHNALYANIQKAAKLLGRTDRRPDVVKPWQARADQLLKEEKPILVGQIQPARKRLIDGEPATDPQ
ncbi:MAG: hypothetical protein HY053_07375 [Proteobacteria bacterium]|nr:hypothetical protein [Pseudomonadota bacterium]